MRNSLFFILSFSLLVIACKKKKSDDTIMPTPETPSTPSIPQEQYIENSIDQVTKEITKSATLAVSGGVAGFCGGSFDTIAITPSQSVFMLRFDEKKICTENGQNISRSGSILLSVQNGTLWKEKGTTLRYEFKNFRISLICDTCEADDYLVEMNGIQSRTNLSGGLEDSLGDNDSLVTEIYARNLTYSYPNKPIRVDNMRLRITTTKIGNELTTAIYGVDSIETGAFAGKKNVAIWGKIWNGKDYYLDYRTPKTYKTCNGKSKIVCAELFYDFRGAYTRTEVYGVDGITGMPNNSCSCSGAGFMLSTIVKGDSTSQTIYQY